MGIEELCGIGVVVSMKGNCEGDGRSMAVKVAVGSTACVSTVGLTVGDDTKLLQDANTVMISNKKINVLPIVFTFSLFFLFDTKRPTDELTCRRVGLLMITNLEPTIAKNGRFPTPKAVRWSGG